VLSWRVASRRFRQWVLPQWLGLCQGSPIQVCVVSLQPVGLAFLVLLPARVAAVVFAVGGVGFCPLRLSVSGRGVVRRSCFGGAACVFAVAKAGFCW